MKTGRPPKKPEDRKSESIKIPLSPDEKAAILNAADKPVTWAREVLLRAAKRRRSVDSKERE